MIDCLLEVVVAPFVIQHVALGSESFATFGTDERSLIFVDALVDSQILLLREAFAACWELTSERLCAIMNVRVRLQTNASLETLAAAFERADKNRLVVLLFSLGLALSFGACLLLLLVALQVVMIKMILIADQIFRLQ
jgi:hypothetical protein